LSEGFDNEHLEMLLRGPGIVSTKIDAAAGEFELSFKPGVVSVFGFPLRFHPAVFPADEIRHEDTRNSTTELVGTVWQIMQEQFNAAAHQERCVVFGRKGSVLNGLSRIPPGTFGRLEVTNWIKGDARTPTEEQLFDLHVASASWSAPGFAPPKEGPKSSKIFEFLHEKYPEGIPLGMTSEALFAEMKDAFPKRGWPSVSRSSVEKAVRVFPRRR
jgi:hypothetical protein